MTKNIYFLAILLLFTSCEDNIVEKIEKVEKKQVEEQNISTPSKKQKSVFQEMGIEFSGDKIIIDINKTDNFFGTLDKRIEKKIEKEIKHKIEKIDINISRDAGINIDDKEINIDLNKTKNMLDNISHIFESVLFESNSTKF